MGLYADHILPWACHLSMKNKEAARMRRQVVPQAEGRVLEVGIGSGLNLPHYGADVAAVVGLDPSEKLLRMTEKHERATAPPFPLELVRGDAAAMPFEARSFDVVLSTWTLCSIADAPRALAEVRRVLRPGGAFIFVEHGRAAPSGVRRWQDRLNPLWRRLSGGCNLNRDIAGLLRGAGFALDRLETGFLVKGPRIATFLYEGRARPA